MPKSTTLSTAILALILAAAWSVGDPPGHAQNQDDDQDQRPPLVQPGAPGDATREIDAAAATDLSGIEATAPDIAFMQGMIGHHAQALEMTELLYERTEWQGMRLLAERIDVSQADEIGMMQGWLEARDQDVPQGNEHHQHEGMLMPGMLTPDQMAELAAAGGTEFDKLFLEYMIMHHQGAVIMVEELFASAGAGQESVIFSFASDVVADQTMEITRMRRMRGSLESR
ncbi:MAG: DUF305 domain-containing protein [Vicinamibacterales bacterium]|jgi:uncharacterized protein (DUF305 family)|nr:DUF305 domain-containing protein [Vicinamibacterales bacterium]MDP7471890.1 DUF305 domain-containing protein [Vicinamibacterales bacterium]MDP7672386.1 DUF305 domain-containing protein [Vicinamibacterales bacterium]HJO39406.1 DUF305 domain-containing protein [Vicinamibacterales bacterium]|tara:strand:+ start:1433 stop:2116 length:684 start_codon:yes stop_codon:yes gene_type:complete